jgi:hypothetical protein
MSLLALALLLTASAPASLPEAPPGLAFGQIRMQVFQHRAHELHCPSGDLDRELEQIVRRLQDRYGKKAFPAHKVPAGGPGDCFVVLSVYRVNLADFRKVAEAALKAPASSAQPPAE